MRRIEWCGLLIKLPPLMSALCAVVLARLLVSRSDGLKYYAVHTLRAGLPCFVCGLADGRHDTAWTPLEGSALSACVMIMSARSCVGVSDTRAC
jgi:hypothetical protein